MAFGNEWAQAIASFRGLWLRHILHVSWTAKKTNEWIVEKVRVTRSLLQAVKKRKLSFCGHTLRMNNSLEKHIIQWTLDGERARGRPQVNWQLAEQHHCLCSSCLVTWGAIASAQPFFTFTAWTPTGMGLQDILRAVEDRAEWRRIIHSVVNHQIEEDWRQDKTSINRLLLLHILCNKCALQLSKSVTSALYSEIDRWKDMGK